MSTRPRQLLTSLISLVLGTACGGDPAGPVEERPAVAAAVATPSHEMFQVPYAFDFSCPGFEANNVGVATGHETVFSSGATPVRSLLRLSLRGALTNLSSGKSLTSRSDFTIDTDLLTGESTISGAQFHLVSQGSGIVVLDAGTVRFDGGGGVTFEGGRHDFVDGDVDPAECEALS
jgi:hypothetical protein